MFDAWKFFREFIASRRKCRIQVQCEILEGYEIVLGKRLGDICFDISSREIEGILGSPNSIERLEPRVFDYVYHSISTTFRFYEYQSLGDGDSLIEIITENPNCTLFGKAVVGVREDKFLLEMKQHNLPFILERVDHILRFQGISLDCYVRDGLIEKVAFGMFF